jgi:hypothetical protein
MILVRVQVVGPEESQEPKAEKSFEESVLKQKCSDEEMILEPLI